MIVASWILFICGVFTLGDTEFTKTVPWWISLLLIGVGIATMIVDRLLPRRN